MPRKRFNYHAASVYEIVGHFKISSRAVIHAQRKKWQGTDLGLKIESAYVLWKMSKFYTEGGNSCKKVFSAEDLKLTKASAKKVAKKLEQYAILKGKE